MIEKIFTAKSVEEAKQSAVLEFGVAENRISFEVLEQPKKSFLGKLKGDAKVKASYEATKAEVAAAYIKALLIKMDIAGIAITITEVEGGAVLDLEGEGLGVIIGRRGETLDALQYLSSLVCNKGDEDYYRITVDSCGYRDKRKATLEELAVKIAKNVARTGRTSALEPMNPYERRIIHAAVSTIEGVASRSQGDEPFRKVIISSTVKRPPRPQGAGQGGVRGPRNNNAAGTGTGNKGGNRGNTSNNKPRNNNNSNGNSGFNKPKRDDFFTSFEKEYKRSKPAPQPQSAPVEPEQQKSPEEEKSSKLYTKLDI